MLIPDKSKFERHLPSLIFAVPALLFFSAGVCAFMSGRWDQLLVGAPFIIALVPGYWGLLPRGGVKHWHACKCTKFDADCEIGFFFDWGQKLFLILPMVLMSVFLGSLLLLHHELREAIIETSLAALTWLIYSALCAWCFYLMVKKFNR